MTDNRTNEELRADELAAVPDAATGRFECDRDCIGEGAPLEECSAHGRTPRDLWDRLDELAAERDAALAAIERVRAEANAYAKQPDVMEPCGAVAQSILLALDEAPEPEWEYGWAGEDNSSPWQLDQEFESVSDAEAFASSADRAWVRQDGGHIVRRRKAGPWEPVEGEKP